MSAVQMRQQPDDSGNGIGSSNGRVVVFEWQMDESCWNGDGVASEVIEGGVEQQITQVAAGIVGV